MCSSLIISLTRLANRVRDRKHSEVKVEKKALLKLLRSKLEGNHTAGELEEPLEYNSHCKSSAVLVATSEIDINGVKVTKLASKVLAKQAGLSLDALSHCMFFLSPQVTWSFHQIVSLHHTISGHNSTD